MPPSRVIQLLAALLAGAVGGVVVLVGLALLTPPKPAEPSGAAAGLRHVPGDSSTLALGIEALRGELAAARERLASHRPAGEPQRQAVAGDALADIARKLDEILRSISSLSATAAPGVQEVLAAHRQNPAPDLAQARALWDSLEVDTKAGTSATRQQWLLLGMADVVRRLGSPMHISVENPRTQSWEYILGKDTAVVLRFVDGLVTSVTQ